jgi:UPF0755 protein
MTMRFAAAVAVAALLLVSAVGFWYVDGIDTPGPGVGEGVVTVVPGASVRSVAKALAKEGVIADVRLFEIHARLTGQEGGVKAGEYLMDRSASIAETLSTLVVGKTRLYPVTVPEGYTAAQIGASLASAGFHHADRFTPYALSAEAARAHGVVAVSLEGFLYPETYHFPKNLSAEKMTAAMVAEFRRRVEPLLPPAVVADPASLLRVVTLASLIEKESANGGERPLISSVFHNRLARGMRLQCDPTVIYALPDFDGNLTKENLRYDSPYNTYVHAGLPPGPIANPGSEAIVAALRPADTPYLYFVAKDRAAHHFSKTLAEHNRAVREYILRKR